MSYLGDFIGHHNYTKDIPINQLIDETNAGYMLIGVAGPGTLPTETGWYIKKVSSGGDITWANGTARMIHIWNDRDTYTYS